MSFNSEEKQAINGDRNAQIKAGKDTVAAIGERSIAVSGDYIVQNNLDDMRIANINSGLEGLVRGQNEIFKILETLGLNKELLESKEVDIEQILQPSQESTSDHTFEELYFLQADSIQSLSYQETLDYQFRMLEISEREEDIIAEYWSRVCLLTTSFCLKAPNFQRLIQ